MLKRWLISGTILMMTAMNSLGQEYDLPKPRSAEQLTEESTVLAWGIGVVFVIGCLVVAFKPAKRANLR